MPTDQAEMQMGCRREMPRYKSHKTVWALKIAAIELKRPTLAELETILNSETTDTSNEPVAAIIHPADEGYAPFAVGESYMRKHKPEVGGYYVVYADGYKSFSPAQAFEEGYTPL